MQTRVPVMVWIMFGDPEFVTALTVTAVFAKGAGASAETTDESPDGAIVTSSQASTAEALTTIDERVAPSETRITADGVEKDYAFGEGSVLTVIESPDIPSGGDGGAAPGMVAAINVGSDYRGYYIVPR